MRTVSGADKIVVLSKETIAEEGSSSFSPFIRVS
jgi:ABC-type transport system involved in Fe-S cluster assembly fused permease/ATPase subunit